MQLEWHVRDGKITDRQLKIVSHYMLAVLLEERKISCRAGPGSSKLYSLPDTSATCATPPEAKPELDSFPRADESKPEAKLSTTQMDESLDEHGMRRVKIIGDGNCLYRCFAHHIFKSEDKYMQVRESVAVHISQNEHVYKDFHLKSEADGKTWDAWIPTLYTEGTWGNHVVLTAAANLWQCLVFVYVDGKSTIVIQPKSYGTDGRSPVESTSILCLAYFNRIHYDVAVPKTDDARGRINQARTPLTKAEAPELDKSIVIKDPEFSLTPLKDAIDGIVTSVNEIKELQFSQMSQTTQHMEGNVTLVTAVENAIVGLGEEYRASLQKVIESEVKMSVKDILNNRHVADLIRGVEEHYEVEDHDMGHEDTNNSSMKTLTDMEVALENLKHEHETLKTLHDSERELFEQQKAQFKEKIAKANWQSSILEADLTRAKSNRDFEKTEAIRQQKILFDKLSSTARKLDQKDAENAQIKTENNTAKTLLEHLLKHLASFVDTLYQINEYDDKTDELIRAKLTKKDSAQMVKTMRTTLHTDQLKRVLQVVNECAKLMHDHGEITDSVNSLEKHLKGEFRLFLKYVAEDTDQKKCCLCGQDGFTEKANKDQNHQVVCDICDESAHLFCIPVFHRDPMCRRPDVFAATEYTWHCGRRDCTPINN